ncbi:MAG: hypothetical protein ACP5GJ_00505 [Nanopusillaceae archaeon]
MINYFELKKWYEENKEKINDSIIKNIFNSEEGIIIEIYKKGIENRFLYIIPGKIIFLYNIKEREETNKFLLRLRKDFNGKKIKFKLNEEDKIIIIETDEKRIYFELFPNGLIIITDLNNKILYANQYKDFGIRKIYKGEEYKKPPKNLFIYNNFDDFYQKIKNSNKKDIVRTLSIDFSLGGKYSEYILNKLNIKKDKKPGEISEEEARKIYEIYREIVELNLIIDNEGNIIKDMNSYFIKLYNSIIENKKIRELNERKEKIKRIMEEQKKHLEEINNEINKMEKIAQFLTIYSWIFSNYDIEEIRKKFGELNININISKENEYLIINIDDKVLENIT